MKMIEAPWGVMKITYTYIYIYIYTPQIFNIDTSKKMTWAM